jgi:rubredoxin
MYRCSRRGFAVVFAEDVPDVSTDVKPSSKFKRIFINRIHLECAFLPASWKALCPEFTTYANANPGITLK